MNEQPKQDAPKEEPVQLTEAERMEYARLEREARKAMHDRIMSKAAPDDVK